METVPMESKITFAKGDLVWDLHSHGRAVHDTLVSQVPGLESFLATFGNEFPGANTCRPFQADKYVRPIGHTRSFCLCVADDASLVFKGTEPMSDDYPDIFREAWEKRPPFGRAAFEYFLLDENEIFYALGLPQALHCARKSLEFCNAFLEAFGYLPKVPVPLMVHRIPQDVAVRFGNSLRPYLSDRGQLSASTRYEHLSSLGMGVYIYYYPGLAIRAGHAKGIFPGSYGIGVHKQEVKFDIEPALEGWVDILSGMLVVGYMPTTKIHAGHCDLPGVFRTSRSLREWRPEGTGFLGPLRG